MFPHGHVHFSLLAEGHGSAGQVIGSLLPDAGLTGAISWNQFHDLAQVDGFGRVVDSDPDLSDVVSGMRHHVMLDERSHDAWSGGGGYAFDKQTDALRETVRNACHVEDDKVRGLAHNFIESAVDLHLLASRPDGIDRLQMAIDAFDLSPLAVALATWTGVETQEIYSKLEEFYRFWTGHDLSTTDGAVELWADLLARLKVQKFDTSDDSPLDRVAARLALEKALDATAADYLAVITP